jgi:hypothetical protein
MNRFIVRALFAVGLLAAVSPARAQLLYSFEDGPQGFGPNGSPLPIVAQDTVGATDGAKSLKFALSQAETFSGALTQTVNQAALLDPNTSAVSFNLTLVPGQDYTGTGFANVGVTLFGSNPPQGIFGVPIQTNGASERNIDLAPGTYTLTIPLVSASGPMRNAFGTGAGQLPVVSGFQFYVSKSGDSPVTLYIDNVRAVPEPAAGAVLVGALCAMCLPRRRR